MGGRDNGKIRIRCERFRSGRSFDLLPSGHNVVVRETRQKNHGSTRDFHLKRRYGLTSVDVNEMIEAQGGVCLICRTGKPEHVDHEHATGKVRGILCFNCNGGLGQFKDQIERLEQAIVYLKDSGTWQKVQVTSGVFRLYSPRPASRPSATSSPWPLRSSRRADSRQPVE